MEKVVFSPGELIGLSLLNGLSIPVGSIGNLLVLFAVSTNKCLQTKPDLFLASLAFADFLITLVCQPMFIYHIRNYQQTTGSYYGETTFFKIFSLLGHLSLIASVSNMFAVTVDRFIAVRFPLKYNSLVTKQRVIVTILAMWFISLALSLFYICYRVVQKVEPNKLVLWFYFTLFLVATVVMYIYILIVARGQEQKICSTAVTKQNCNSNEQVSPGVNNDTEKTSNRERKRESKSTKTIAIIVGVFLLCWLPLILFSALEGWRESSAWFIRRFQWFHTISMCNSCFNPYIYCARSQRYRSAFQRYLWCHLCQMNTSSETICHKTNKTT